MNYFFWCGVVVNAIFALGILFSIVCGIKVWIEDILEERRREKYGIVGDRYWREDRSKAEAAKGEIGRDLGRP